jgi:hypothetical protein
MRTDITIPNNKPYITIRNNERGTCLFIDTAISGVTNVTKKEPKNILKYKDLTVEMQYMRNLKKVMSNNMDNWNHFQSLINNIPRNH